MSTETARMYATILPWYSLLMSMIASDICDRHADRRDKTDDILGSATISRRRWRVHVGCPEEGLDDMPPEATSTQCAHALPWCHRQSLPA